MTVFTFKRIGNAIVLVVNHRLNQGA